LLNNILKPIFNIKDERKNKNIRFISGKTETSGIINDLKENEILFKRDHTISGYTLNYVVEGKLNK
jgi:uncharacterized protein (DUF1015 family)